MRGLSQKLGQWLIHWLTRDRPPAETPLCNFDRLRFELRPCDVLLVEGRSRIADVIRVITQSPWSHAVLYIGRIFDIRDPRLRVKVEAHFEGDPEEQLIIEALAGEGTIVSPLSRYQKDHVRICRPDGISAEDAQQVMAYAINQLGTDYDMRQILDLARFLFPWSILPRRWRSTLFEHNAGATTRTVCSTLLAEAFMQVDFPILPFIERDEDGSLRLFKRNPKLFAPRDFDYSPYFSIIKYPYLGFNDVGIYRRLPWDPSEEFHSEQPRRRPQPETEPEAAEAAGRHRLPDLFQAAMRWRKEG